MYTVTYLDVIAVYQEKKFESFEETISFIEGFEADGSLLLKIKTLGGIKIDVQ